MVVRNVMQALDTFVDTQQIIDPQDNCHTAVPAFPI